MLLYEHEYSWVVKLRNKIRQGQREEKPQTYIGNRRRSCKRCCMLIEVDRERELEKIQQTRPTFRKGQSKGKIPKSRPTFMDRDREQQEIPQTLPFVHRHGQRREWEKIPKPCPMLKQGQRGERILQTLFHIQTRKERDSQR